MSVRVMSWVWSQSQSTSTARFVLLAIADVANDAGAEAYPSMASLVRKTRLSERTVQGALKTLVDLGELVVYPNAGPKGTNRYRIVMATPAESAPPQNLHPPAGDAGAESAPPQISHPTPADTAPLPPQNLHPNHPLTIHEPKKTSTRSSTATTGTRIPDDFAATPEMVAWARKETPLVGQRDTEAFIDYWRARPGAGGRKTDWLATWRNWMRKAQSDAERQGANGSRASPGRGFVERDGRRLKTETAANLDLIERMKALDEQTGTPAIERNRR